MSPDETQALQSAQLVQLVQKVYQSVPFYKSRMDDLGVTPEDIKSIADIRQLPFTTKDDMRETYPLGLLSVDQSEIVEVHTSSGTTGKPVVDAYTIDDIDLWSEVMARTLGMGNITSKDTVQNAFGYGLFTGGLGVHYGSRRIGANVIPISGGNTIRQLAILQDFKATALTCTPSYCLYLAEVAAENNINFKDLNLKVGFFGAEPWSEKMRAEIEKKLDLKAIDIYGLTEIIGPGVASECLEQDGLHIYEDHFYPEIINPETLQPAAEGEKGELVITTLTKQGTPILRYRTRDITFFRSGTCACGRTQRRMNRLLGRTDDMLIIRGVNIFPSQIEEVLFNIDHIEPHYQLVVERVNQLDTLEVQVELNEKSFSDEVRKLEEYERKVEKDLHTALGIQAKVKLMEPKSIQRSEGKAKRIIDNRQI
jgi:phenylacetate-CoA ligase